MVSSVENRDSISLVSPNGSSYSSFETESLSSSAWSQHIEVNGKDLFGLWKGFLHLFAEVWNDSRSLSCRRTNKDSKFHGLEDLKKSLQNHSEVYDDDPWKYIEDLYKHSEMIHEVAKRHSDSYVEDASYVIDKLQSGARENMVRYGYCCGDHRMLPPLPLCCNCKTPNCMLMPGSTYYDYSEKEVRFCLCPNGFRSLSSPSGVVKITFDDNESNTVELPRKYFFKKRNVENVPESFIRCRECKIKLHDRCLYYAGPPTAFRCNSCSTSGDWVKLLSRWSAEQLPETDSSRRMENAVNFYLDQFRNQESIGKVFVRMLACTENYFTVKPAFQKLLNVESPRKFTYWNKCYFAFQQMEGADVAFFAMYVNEYGPTCPSPDNSKIYLSYLDSVNFFQPQHLRTMTYKVLLLEYLSLCCERGFEEGFIWSCPPEPGCDYIFYGHPEAQKIPSREILQMWYIDLFNMAIDRNILISFENISSKWETKTPDLKLIPYLYGDVVPGFLEEAIEEEIKPRGKRKHSGPKELHQKEIEEKVTLKLIGALKSENYFVFKFNSKTTSQVNEDPDRIITFPLCESRNELIAYCVRNFYRFSDLRQAKYTTQVLLQEALRSLHKNLEECTLCSWHLSTLRFHCKHCSDFNLCYECLLGAGHEHPMNMWIPGKRNDFLYIYNSILLKYIDGGIRCSSNKYSLDVDVVSDIQSLLADFKTCSGSDSFLALLREFQRLHSESCSRNCTLTLCHKSSDKYC